MESDETYSRVQNGHVFKSKLWYPQDNFSSPTGNKGIV